MNVEDGQNSTATDIVSQIIDSINGHPQLLRRCKGFTIQAEVKCGDSAIKASATIAPESRSESLAKRIITGCLGSCCYAAVILIAFKAMGYL